MPGDTEARIIRLEQLVYITQRRVKKAADNAGTLAQAITLLRDSVGDGAPPPGSVYFDPGCGIYLPATLPTMNCTLFAGGVGPALNWDAIAGQWVGGMLATQDCARSTTCTVLDPTVQSAVVFQLTPGSPNYLLTMQWKRCTTGGVFVGTMMPSSVPGTLTGTDLFGGGGDTGTDTNASPLGCAEHSWAFPNSRAGSGIPITISF